MRFVWAYVSDARKNSSESSYLLIQGHLCDEDRSFGIGCSPATCARTFRCLWSVVILASSQVQSQVVSLVQLQTLVKAALNPEQVEELGRMTYA